jgi:tryptophanyl-tRNA synthetase
MRIQIFSGIQPTGVPHLGNYLGALKRWSMLQKGDSFPSASGEQITIETESLYCMVDLHALTVHQEPAALQKSLLDTTASLLACGINPQCSIIFRQSAISHHSFLAWILGTMTPMGMLSRMTQWKVSLFLKVTIS